MASTDRASEEVRLCAFVHWASSVALLLLVHNLTHHSYCGPVVAELTTVTVVLWLLILRGGGEEEGEGGLPLKEREGSH